MYLGQLFSISLPDLFWKRTWADPITAQLTETGADTRKELFGNSLRLLLGLQSGDFEVIRCEAEVELGV